MLKFTPEQGWAYHSSRTPVPYCEDKIYNHGSLFIWPNWAVEEVNKLGANLEAIKQISDKLKPERGKNVSSTRFSSAD